MRVSDKDYRDLVAFIAHDYHELSHDKIRWQRDDWKKRCRELLDREATTYSAPKL